MQDAGRHLEKSAALGVLMENEERRLNEAVRRCDMWALCSSLVLGIQVDLLMAIGADGIEWDEWSTTSQTLLCVTACASIVCMGWVAYDVLLAAEEAQAIAHARPPPTLSLGDELEATVLWARVRANGAFTTAGVDSYEPLCTMRRAVVYLETCIGELRVVFGVGLLMAVAVFLFHLATLTPPASPPFIAGATCVLLTVGARLLWRRHLRGLRGPLSTASCLPACLARRAARADERPTAGAADVLLRPAAPATGGHAGQAAGSSPVRAEPGAAPTGSAQTGGSGASSCDVQHVVRLTAGELELSRRSRGSRSGSGRHGSADNSCVVM